MKKVACCGVLIASLLLSACGEGHDPRRRSHGKHDHGEGGSSRGHAADSNEKPYPLKTCVVSGKALGSVGEPATVVYKGHEIKLCCKGCDKDFQKDPEKYVKKVAEAWGKWHESHGSDARPSSPQTAKPVAVGDTVSDFEVTDLAGKTWKLSDLQKRTESGVVSLTFWCTFCHSCRMMDARFQKMAEDFEGKAAVLGLDASAADTPKRIEDFAREKKFAVPVLVDAQGKGAELFGVKLTTTTVVIDKAGVLRYRGLFDGQGVPHAQNALKAVLEGKEVTVKETTPAG